MDSGRCVCYVCLISLLVKNCGKIMMECVLLGLNYGVTILLLRRLVCLKLSTWDWKKAGYPQEHCRQPGTCRNESCWPARDACHASLA